MKRILVLVLLLTGCGSGGGSSSDNGSTTTPPPPGGGGSGTATPPTYTGAGSAANYWIDPAGSDTNTGTAASPWATLDKLESIVLAPGDLVHVRPGTYNLATNLVLTGKNGTAAGWIGIQAEGAVTLRNAVSANVIDISDCHYLFLRGFEITHDNGGAAYNTGASINWAPVDGVKFQGLPSDHVSIDSCDIHDLGNVGCSSQVSLIDSVTVVNCEIYNCYTGLYWGYYEDVNKRYAHFGLIAGNYVHDCPPVDADGTGYGMQIKGGSRGNRIEDNVFVNCGGSTRAAIAVYHISTNLATYTEHNVIRGNYIRAARNEGIFAVEGATIENNIVVDSRFYGIDVNLRNTGSWGTFYGNLLVRNNSIFRVTDPGGRALFVGNAAFTAPLIVSNNVAIVTGPGTQQAFRCPSTFTGTAAGNFAYGATAGFPSGVTALATLAPIQSTTPGTPNFLFPTAGGALVDAGSGSGPADDFNGTPRVTPDAGAYESTGAGNPGWILADAFKP